MPAVAARAPPASAPRASVPRVTVPNRLLTRPSSAAGTCRCRMVTAVMLNKAHAPLLTESIAAATITLPVRPRPAWLAAMATPASSSDRHGPSRRVRTVPAPPVATPPSAPTASSRP